MRKVTVKPNLNRLKIDIETIAQFRDHSKLGWTRRAFSEEYKKSRQWLKNNMEQAGMETYIDSASNLIGRIPGSDESLKPIMIGSHTDTVVGGGRFDGIIGVLSGIEAARMIKEAGITLKHTLEIADFTSEEPSDFGISTIGSRGMVGKLTEQDLKRKDQNGEELFKCIEALGGRTDTIQKYKRKKGDLALYLELHIEQGPVLEQNHCKLGVVTGIVGIHRYRVTVQGKTNHVGTTPMNMRYDALALTSELILYLESICKGKNKQDVVGTVGKLNVHPNGSNVVPGKCIFEFEVRALDEKVIEEIVCNFIESAHKFSSIRGVSVEFDNISKSKPSIVDDTIQQIIKDVCDKTANNMFLPSGAGHDANHIYDIGPIGMIFVPSKDGRSHCPEEYTCCEDIALGVEALFYSLMAFDNKFQI
ncbi:M20 family metallo-hydrolase [Clostridium sp. DJ247]|uniref:M20 family metallo-hydrolase n=1 Tax=Clostridium sp. DJ247 TaxID=2726188 RepID=UPI00162376E1|nr:M20 family metallo-hydrolase [Clostridium sp. DJ247]MBC2582633.1 M20 family metallo-hydrolase [Clostridium sp. DJ247]